MGCVIDHLGADLRVRVLQDFSDARGVRHAQGEEGITRRIELDWPRQEIALTWERDGRSETMVFALAARAGPGNGRMREYFEVVERVADPVPPPSRRWVPPDLPAPSSEPVGVDGTYAAAWERLWALAARADFDAAEAQLRLLFGRPDPQGGILQQAAEDMAALACRHTFDPNRAVFDWARARAVGLCYAWGAQATSGGEGAARLDFIQATEDKLAAAAAQRG